MKNTTTRLGWLIGPDNLAILGQKTILLFGCGGVGSFAMEALVRSGIGRIIVVDGDEVDITNMNRQLVAEYDTVGWRKVKAAEKRCQAINKEVEFVGMDMVYTKTAHPEFIANMHEQYHIDFIIDAIDMVTAKINIIEEAKRLNIPVISSMGMGNKLDPTKIDIADISKTRVCPLARVMRKALKERRITKVPVAFSTEEARTPQRDDDSRSPGSCGFVPSVAGLGMTSYVIRQLLNL